MTRTSTKKDQGNPSPGKKPQSRSTQQQQQAQEEETPSEHIGIFPYTVSTFKGKLPLHEGYDAEKDRLLIGFKIGQSTVPSHLPKEVKLEDVTPYDFLTNPHTHKRTGQVREPWSSATHNLKDGIEHWTPLPPVEIWANGMWLTDAVWKDGFDLKQLNYQLEQKVTKCLDKWPSTGVPQELFAYWLTSGEGTPGNNLYRVYELPDELAKKATAPHHPENWPERLKKKEDYSYGYGGLSGPKSGTTTTYSSGPKLPAGVRFRCPGCGHWFKTDDLKGHQMVCGQGDYTEWAVMCDPACGCRNLHEAAQPKEGFPRKEAPPKSELFDKKEEEEETSDGLTIAEEPITL